jgi:predicted unusual protein kinase regulating ubiquinone biosynthesis (AarF/ABC1/UbiB family)
MIIALIFLLIIYFNRYYIFQLWSIMCLIYYLVKTIKILNKGDEVDIQIITRIQNYINNIGIFSIKMVQWLNNRFKLISNDKNIHSFLKHFEIYYENCPQHSLEFTKKTFFQDFGKEIEEVFTIIPIPIASASIGQVYRGICKKTKKEIALKCVHPNISKQIFIPKYILLIFNMCFSYLPYFNKFKIPIDLYGFFDFIEDQIDLRKEVKNMTIMRKNYIDNEMLIIPEPILYSKNIIVMSYEEGDFFENLKISDYKKSKIIIAFKIFLRSSLLCENFVHGDLHDGNWKVRINPKKKNMYQIILYDLGICLPVNDKFINDFLENFDKKNIGEMVDSILENGIHYIPSEYIGKEDEIRNELISNLENECDLSRIDTNEILKILIPLMTKKGIILKNIFLNLLVVIMLTQEHIRKYSETTVLYTGDENKDIRKNNLFKIQYPSMISFCKTYNCFPDYLKKMLDIFEKNNTDLDLFDGVEEKLNFFDSDNGFEKIDLDDITNSDDETSSDDQTNSDDETSSDKENNSDDETSSDDQTI